MISGLQLHHHVPLLYTYLSYGVGAMTIVMAASALFRLRPEIRQTEKGDNARHARAARIALRQRDGASS